MGKVINLQDATKKKAWLFVPITTEFSSCRIDKSVEESLGEKCRELNYDIVGSTSVCGDQRVIYHCFCNLIECLHKTHCAQTIYTLSLAFIFETASQFDKIENLLRDMNISFEGLDKMKLPRSLGEIEAHNRLVQEILLGPLPEHLSKGWCCSGDFPAQQSANKQRNSN